MKHKFTATLPLALLAIGMLGSVTSANADLNNSIYVALDASCRVGDTRGTSTPTIPVDGHVEWFAYGVDMSVQGGEATGCLQPKTNPTDHTKGMDPIGIAVNITAAANGAATTRNGNLVAYAADATPPTEGSVVNYTPGINIANSTIVGLGPDGKFIIQSNLAEVRAIADVQGYFYARPSGVAQVAVRGGDYSSPVDAMNDLDAWCGTPSETNTCLMKIAPGTYDVGAVPVIMQAGVSIQGSGFASTQIVGGVSGDDEKTSAIVQGAEFATLSDLEIINHGDAGGDYSTGIYNEGIGFFILGVEVNASGGAINTGIFNFKESTDTIQNSHVSAHGGSQAIGIYNDASGSGQEINDVSVRVTGAATVNTGIINFQSSPTMSRVSVVVDAGGGNVARGVVNEEALEVVMKDVNVRVQNGAETNIAVWVELSNVIMKNSEAVAIGPGVAVSIFGQTPTSQTLIWGSYLGGDDEALRISVDSTATRIVNNLIEGYVDNWLKGAAKSNVCLNNFDEDLQEVDCK